MFRAIDKPGKPATMPPPLQYFPKNGVNIGVEPKILYFGAIMRNKFFKTYSVNYQQYKQDASQLTNDYAGVWRHLL